MLAALAIGSLAVAALVVAGPAAAAKPVTTKHVRTVTTVTTITTVKTVTNPLPTTPITPKEALTTAAKAERLFLADPKVAHWLTRYPPHPVTDASYADGTWTVNVFSGKAGEIATGTVDDASGAVIEAWTGPQAAWKMARGYPGAFGGVKLNTYE
ncbi:MAG: hypothetical protein ACRDLF_04070, partial [Solirubrobacteraceae bacterium]